MQVDEIDYGNIVNIYHALLREQKTKYIVDDKDDLGLLPYYYAALIIEREKNETSIR